MIKDMSGTRMLNPRYIKEIRITRDEDEVMRYIVAYVQGGGYRDPAAGEHL